jgi:hypothetical protein
LGILRGERGKRGERGERGDREEDRGAAERGEGWEGKGDLWARVSRERVSGHWGEEEEMLERREGIGVAWGSAPEVFDGLGAVEFVGVSVDERCDAESFPILGRRGRVHNDGRGDGENFACDETEGREENPHRGTGPFTMSFAFRVSGITFSFPLFAVRLEDNDTRVMLGDAAVERGVGEDVSMLKEKRDRERERKDRKREGKRKEDDRYRFKNIS